MFAGGSNLDFEKVERLPRDTSVNQCSDGTIFYNYWSRSEPERLYVKWGGKEIDAVLPEGKIENIGTHGSSLYFSVNRKIYKVTFSPPAGIEVTFLREQLQDELFFWGGWCSSCRDGKSVVYRMNEDSDSDGIVVDVEEDEMIGADLAGIHRGRLFYTILKERLTEPSVRRLCNNVYMIELPDCQRTVSAYAQDSLNYLYLENGQHLFTLNTATLEFLPPLEIDINCVYFIAGVHNGVITIRGITSYFDWHLMTARLPAGYS